MSTSPRARGIDVGSWQHPAGRAIDWAKVAEDGYTFAMIKVSQGIDYVNPYVVEDFEGAHAHGLICGGYHFYEEGPDPAAQGEHFVNSAVGRVMELGAYIDWEPNTMPDYKVTGDYTALLNRIEEVRRPCGLYVDESWREIFVRLQLPIHRLWSADWGVESPPAGAMIWQRGTASVEGIVGPVDEDVLLSIRGIPLPKVPKAAETPFVAAVKPEAKAEGETPAQELSEPQSEPEGSQAES